MWWNKIHLHHNDGRKNETPNSSQLDPRTNYPVFICQPWKGGLNNLFSSMMRCYQPATTNDSNPKKLYF